MNAAIGVYSCLTVYICDINFNEGNQCNIEIKLLHQATNKSFIIHIGSYTYTCMHASNGTVVPFK